jgi:hypothetical protein
MAKLVKAVTMLDAALEYGARGSLVFPCSAEKTPLTAHGFDDATDDAGQITAWWSKDPEACIGMAVPEGVAVIDIDPRNGGNETIKALRSEHGRGAFPSTKTAKTGGGGVHKWYAVDPALELRGKLGRGVDVKRAGRGYVIVPPSFTVVGRYTWTRGGEVATMPDWMVEALTKPAPKPEAAERAADAPTIPPFTDGTAYGERALHLEVERLREAQPGERNDALNRAAFSLAQLIAGGELLEEPAVAALTEAAADLGLEDRETEATLESAMAAGFAEPRNAPERPEAEQTSNRTSSAPASLLDVLGDEDDVLDEDAEAHFWLDWSGEAQQDDFILWPLIPRHAYVLVYGATEASKSMVWNALGAQASCRGYSVSVYSLENPATVDRSRLQRLEPCRELFRCSNQLLNLADPAQVLAMRERERGRDLVIIDTYSHAFAQRYDSGDGNAKAIEFARVIRWLMRQTGATYIVLDHTGFERPEEPRDASAKRQQVDVAIGMERTHAWVRGQPARFSMTNYKSARFANPFSYRGMIVGNDAEPLRLKWDGKEEMKWGDEE